MKLISRTVLTLLAVLLGGCSTPGTLQKLTTGAVACPPEKITIVDDSGASGMNVWTWTAKCDNETYFCSKTSNGNTQCAVKPKKTP